MLLNLYRSNYLLVGATSKKTMRLLPATGDSQTQKIAVGDHDGNLHVFSVKKEGIQLSFKASPGPKITCLDLGGQDGTTKDKVFVSTDNEVHAFTKRGKPFFNINTNLTEPIKSMKTLDKHLYICGNYICNHYENGVDVGYMVYEEEIVDFVCIKSKKNRDIIPIIASKDGTISIIKHDQIKHKVELSSQPTVLHISLTNKDENPTLFFGTLDGRVGKMNLHRYLYMSAELSRDSDSVLPYEWILQDIGRPRRDSVLCIDTFDLTGDGTPDLLIGRQDGSIEVYAMEDGEELSRRFSFNCNESVTSIQAGFVGKIDTPEIVASTASGWVFGLISEDLGKQEGLTQESQTSGFSREARQKILLLRSEITDLEQKVSVEREKYLASTEDKNAGLSAIPFFNINHEMAIVKENSSYILTIETQVPLDSVLLQCNVPLDLIDIEKNSAVVSYSKCDPESDNHLLASYRCQVNARRLQIEIYTTEGQGGTLRAYVTPQLQPKCCRVLMFSIRPLSLHSRCNSIDLSRSQNVLHLKGSFSMAEIHSWIYNCLPDVPERLPTEYEVTYCFRSTFIDTQLQCKYSKGKAEFTSDNITTISILKDIITNEATKKNIILEISCDMNELSISEMLHRIDPLLSSFLSLKKKIRLIDALHEILDPNSEGNPDILEKEYRDLLEKEVDIRKEFTNRPYQLKRIHGMITDLYINSHKFKGINVKGRLPQLIDLLDNYSVEKLIAFFKLEL